MGIVQKHNVKLESIIIMFFRKKKDMKLAGYQMNNVLIRRLNIIK